MTHNWSTRALVLVPLALLLMGAAVTMEYQDASIPSSALQSTGVSAGTTGDSTHTTALTVNAQGQVTGATSTAIATMAGASAGANGASGFVPQPTAGQQANFLRGDGTWVAVSGTGTVTSITCGSTMSCSPNPVTTTGSVDIDLTHANTWSGAQTHQNGTLLVDNSANTFATTIASAATAARVFTLPDATDTACGLAATQTLTNKTLTTSGSLIANGTTIINNRFELRRTTVADVAYTQLSTDIVIAYTSISAARVVTGLCTTGSTANPAVFFIKDESGSASGTNTITFTPASGTIDGSASKVIINSAFGSVRIYNNGTNCFTW